MGGTRVGTVKIVILASSLLVNLFKRVFATQFSMYEYPYIPYIAYSWPLGLKLVGSTGISIWLGML